MTDEPQYLAECCGTGRTPPCNACPKLKPALNVVSMPVRNLQDIPALLRNKADEIERGEMGDVRTCFVVFPRTDDYPRVFGWGDIDGTRDPAIQLQLAVQWLLANLTKRN